MVSADRVPHRVRDGRLEPGYLDTSDHPWMRELVEAYVACVGEPRRVLDARLRSEWRGGPARDVVLAVLDREFGHRVVAAVPPRQARAVACRAAARVARTQAALRTAADELGVSIAALQAALLADVPRERRLTAPVRLPELPHLVLDANLAMAQACLQRATQVTLELEGNSRAVVRLAQLRGLICTIRSPTARPAEDAVQLAISGPLSLFRRTTMYGRALAELVPLLAWSKRFTLTAPCRLRRGTTATLQIRTAEPILPAREPRRYDSRVEQRFARDFLRLAPDWELVREPEPVAAAGTLIFPDFSLRHRFDRRDRWLVEIVGFWTAGYVEQKLHRLRAADVRRFVLCIDQARDCGSETLPPHAHVLRYTRHIDVGAVLHLIESDRASSAS